MSLRSVYRGAFAYNLMDAHKRRFCAELPMLVQWDDHETRNNWYPGQRIGAAEKRYQERSASLLSAPSGRELEVADLLGFIKRRNIKNVVWVTADVHYASATQYRPERAQFTDFKPFWEFVGGPLHAGTFGPGEIDNTFGPDVKFVSIPPDMKQSRPPSDGLQFFGIGRVDARSKVLTVSLHGLDGKKLYAVELPPEA